MKKLILIPLVLSLLFTPLASAESPGRIVGGKPAAENSWPAQALIVSRGYFCGGTLIHPRWVVSAAHCFSETGARPSNTQIRLGSHNFYGGTKHKVSGIYLHARYTSSFDNDIALLRLAAPSNQPPQRIARPEDSALWSSGSAPGYIAGWGTVCFRYCSPSNNLLEATVPLREAAICSAIYSSVDIFYSDNMICAGGGRDTADACQGDSGGPLEIDGLDGRMLLGIVSWGIGCAEEDFPGVYTNISRYSGWIGSRVIDQIAAPTSVGVQKRATITLVNQGSLQLPASVRTQVKGDFRIEKNRCRDIAYGSSCSIEIIDTSRKRNSGEVLIRNYSGSLLARVTVRD